MNSKVRHTFIVSQAEFSLESASSSRVPTSISVEHQHHQHKKYYWLILLTVKPNDTVNWVMKTENFDNGSFWLMVDPSTSMIWASVAWLLLVAIGYASAFVKLFIRRKRALLIRQESRIESMKNKLHRDILREAEGESKNRITAFFAQAILLFVKDDSHAMKLTVRTVRIPPNGGQLRCLT
ncbi:unnamed protein product [Phytophthora lilii]|uniref:Unnamed protein product n=1 Tax=Phytophthora lilii TaxID=2077276 RepID=A0A9W6TXQ6_9STRA|nr:unnamed protein product [Phytophthora lilii]